MDIIIHDESSNSHVELARGDTNRKIVFSNVPSGATLQISTGVCGITTDAIVAVDGNKRVVTIPDEYLLDSEVISIFINASSGVPLARYYFPVNPRCV